MIKAVVTGAAGRMGSRIVNVLSSSEGIRLSGAVERKGHAMVGQDSCGPAGLPSGAVLTMITDDLAAAIKAGDVLIDFTMPEASLEHIRLCAELGKACVIGSTGFSKEQLSEVNKHVQRIPCVLSPNMSVGVNVCFKILADLAKILGPDFDPEIVEWHHRLKKDAPSGTAVHMGEVVAKALGRDYHKAAKYHREGITGARTNEEIGMQTVRGGDIVGEHTVYFIGMGERIELTHRAHTRDMFVRGAVRAAKWVVGKKPGLYDMQDVLGLK
ncbi:MAG: 4-hydroxy-tetrahydrodipicolinate reductase [Nitrospirae bacterium GWD2_57_9]|nr:MAG: 4-hydroxy-tetrahydrodipicolinate reductase [Nitrospirae bacterium GWD2_57_9]OGW47216.1 MAG: 4-hydroxy-tetrahydrodipicolinate reductase [Nitrospirae bacterium GWC2_57_9]